MKRYDNVKIQSRYDGKRVYKTTIYPIIYPSSTDIQIISAEGDSLDTLAYKYYKDPTLYWIIALANNIGKGRMSVEPLLNLIIPTDINGIINKFNSLNR